MNTVTLQDKVLKPQSVFTILNDIDTRLNSLKDKDISNLESMTDVLRQIILKFGGTVTTDFEYEYTVEITEDDIKEGRNTVFFPQEIMEFKDSEIIFEG